MSDEYLNAELELDYEKLAQGIARIVQDITDTFTRAMTDMQAFTQAMKIAKILQEVQNGDNRRADGQADPYRAAGRPDQADYQTVDSVAVAVTYTVDSTGGAGESASIMFPDPLPVVPDRTEPIEAWRAWRITPNRLLASTTGIRVWPPRCVLEAKCYHGGYVHSSSAPIPQENCTCGIYAYRDIDLALIRNEEVIGRVALWGIVIPHALGYRAQFAYPINLWVRSSKYRDYLAQAYGVPVYSMSGPESFRGHR